MPIANPALLPIIRGLGSRLPQFGRQIGRYGRNILRNPIGGGVTGGAAGYGAFEGLDALFGNNGIPSATGEVGQSQPTIVQPMVTQRYQAPPGYVIIRRKRGGQEIVFAMLKSEARKQGLWKPARKPLISVRDSEAIKRANRARGKLERAAKGAGLHVYKNPRSTRRAPAKKC